MIIEYIDSRGFAVENTVENALLNCQDLDELFRIELAIKRALRPQLEYNERVQNDSRLTKADKRKLFREVENFSESIENLRNKLET